MKEVKPHTLSRVKDVAVTALAAGTIAGLGTISAVEKNRDTLVNFIKKNLEVAEHSANQAFQTFKSSLRSNFVKTASDQDWKAINDAITNGNSEESVRLYEDLVERGMFASAKDALLENAEAIKQQIAAKHNELFTPIESLKKAVTQAEKTPFCELLPKGKQLYIILGATVAAATLTAGAIHLIHQLNAPSNTLTENAKSLHGTVDVPQRAMAL